MESYPPTTDYEKLSIAEKILNLQDAWDRIAARPETVTVTEAQKQELDSRIEAMGKNPEVGTTWEATKDELRKNK